eukprot:3308966-Rhodomonas_salina.5
MLVLLGTGYVTSVCAKSCAPVPVTRTAQCAETPQAACQSLATRPQCRHGTESGASATQARACV